MDESSPNEFEAAVEAQLRYWQQVLRLQDWNISLQVVRQHDLGDPEAIAECQYYIDRKDAFIRVIPPSDLDKFEETFMAGEARDYDVTLTHELLHLHFAGFDDPQHEQEQEQVINTLSRALVKLYREAGPSKPPPTMTKPGHYL